MCLHYFIDVRSLSLNELWNNKTSSGQHVLFSQTLIPIHRNVNSGEKGIKWYVYFTRNILEYDDWVAEFQKKKEEEEK